jgi:hypothetical protein
VSGSVEQTSSGMERGVSVVTIQRKQMKVSAMLDSVGAGILEQAVLERTFYKKKIEMETLLEARCISKEDETDSEDGGRWLKVLGRCNRVAFKGSPGLQPRRKARPPVMDARAYVRVMECKSFFHWQYICLYKIIDFP